MREQIKKTVSKQLDSWEVTNPNINYLPRLKRVINRYKSLSEQDKKDMFTEIAINAGYCEPDVYKFN